jgi:hypothetical protein
MRRITLLGATGVLFAGLASAAPAASTVTADGAASRACHTRLATGAPGIATRRVVAAAEGLVVARLRGRGDWDVAVYDARTRRAVAAGAGAGGSEVAEGFVRKGDRLIVQACRLRGAARTARLGVSFEAAGRTATSAAATFKVQVVDIRVGSPAAKRRLQALGLDLTEHGDADSVEAVLWGQADVDRLVANKFRYRVRVADLAARSKTQADADRAFAAATTATSLPSGRDTYRRLADYEYELKTLASTYPSRVKLISLKHPTWQGRTVYGVEIATNVAANDGRPVFVNMGAHHAREWPSAENAMEFAYDLAKGTDRRTNRLLGATRTIVVPVVNPDGFNVSREARLINEKNAFSAHDFEMKRKNCRDNVANCDQRSRLHGVDLNRNYGGFWGGPGAGTALLDDTYRGPSAFSEPESRNIQELVAAHQVTTLITNHTYSNLILRAPGIAEIRPPLEEPQYKALGAAMAAKNGYANVPGYNLYDTSGTTEDWSFWSAGGFGFTFEIGGTDFHPAFETGVVAEYLGLKPSTGAGTGGNREAYFAALEATANTALHSRITGTAPAGAQLEVRKTFKTLTWADFKAATPGTPATGFADGLASTMIAPGGTFTWHVNPSTRPEVAGRYGRTSTLPAQTPNITLANPAGFPGENTSYPEPIAQPYEEVSFTVKGAADGVDNGEFNVHIEWADPANDWDVYVYDASGREVTSAADFGDTTEDARLADPPAGTYVARIINYDQVGKGADDWHGEVRFSSPLPADITGIKEAWTFTCSVGGSTLTRNVEVDRGQTASVGNACPATVAPRKG